MPVPTQPVNSTAIRSVLSAGAGIVGAGAGSLLSLLAGHPVGAVGGAMAGQFIGSALSDVAARRLSMRERARVGAVAEYAAAALIKYTTRGSRIRSDGFFIDEFDWRSAGAEVIEGVLLVAQRTYEERKLQHLGRLLATVAVHDEIDQRTANTMISLADSLRWEQLVILSLIGRHDEFDLPDRDIGVDVASWEKWSAHRAISELRSEPYVLIGSLMARTEQMGLPFPNIQISDQRLTPGGILLFEAMDLDEISKAEAGVVLESLRADPPSNDPATPE